MCQTLLNPEELLAILKDSKIENFKKKPVLKYYLNSYMKAPATVGTSGDGAVNEVAHDPLLWEYLQSIVEEAEKLKTFLENADPEVAYYIVNNPFPKR